MFKTHKGIRTFSLANYQSMTYLLGVHLARVLLTLKQDKEWLSDILQINTTLSGNDQMDHITVGKNIYDKCSSLQEFINNINTTDHFISADWFHGVSIRDIMEIMALRSDPTPYFYNAKDYFAFIQESGSDFDRPVPSIGVTRPRNTWVRQRIIGPGMSDIDWHASVEPIQF